MWVGGEISHYEAKEVEGEWIPVCRSRSRWDAPHIQKQIVSSFQVEPRFAMVSPTFTCRLNFRGSEGPVNFRVRHQILIGGPAKSRLLVSLFSIVKYTLNQKQKHSPSLKYTQITSKVPFRKSKKVHNSSKFKLKQREIREQNHHQPNSS